MKIAVEHRQTSPDKLRARHGPDARILDLTSRGDEPWVRFSPFFPHGDIPVPFTEGRVAASVEGVWQGLKVFESADVDPATLDNATMKGLKRTVRRFGRCLGHRRGLEGQDLLDYRSARWQIYLPTYLWALENPLAPLLEELRALAADAPLVLLDYEKNTDPEDLRRPLSHAGLVQAALEGSWPGCGPYTMPREEGVVRFYRVNEPWGEFSNFAAFPIEVDGKVWPTSEHFFQAQKFPGAPDQEEIRSTASPMKAARMGRERSRPFRADWDQVRDDAMRVALRAKFTQHEATRAALLATGQAHLIEHTVNDSYWADGGDGQGANRLGELLVELRAELAQG